MQSEEVSMSLKVLRAHGWSISAPAREFGLNWRTVKREVESPLPRVYGPRDRPAAPTSDTAKPVRSRRSGASARSRRNQISARSSAARLDRCVKQPTSRIAVVPAKRFQALQSRHQADGSEYSRGLHD